MFPGVLESCRQGYAAISWYHANRQEFETSLAEELEEAERLEALDSEDLKRTA